MGQFKVPFGYEVLQSSADREMPERARVIRALFPGERDRGARLTGTYQWFNFMAALVNGNFTQGDAVFNTFDNNRYFDTYLRVGADLDFIVVHLSGQFGEKLGTTVGNAALTIADKNMDGIITADEITPAATNVTMRRFGIWRFGADAEFYVDVPAVGGLALKGELVLSQDTNKDFRGAPADPCRDIKGFGWILTLNQNIGDSFGFAARLDQWNPNRDLDASCTDAQKAVVSKDKITTLGLGPLLFVSANLKASAIYEHLGATTASRSAQRASPRPPPCRAISSPCNFKPGSRFPISDSKPYTSTQEITNMKLRALIAPLVGFASLALSALPAQAGTITVKGSDTMVILGQRWAEEYMKKHPATVLQVTGGGSGTGISALINGTTDICESSRAMKHGRKGEAARPLQQLGLRDPRRASDGLAVYVNASSPLTELDPRSS